MTTYSSTIIVAGLAVEFRTESKNLYKDVQRRYVGYIDKRKKPLLILDCRFSYKRGTADTEVSIEKKHHGWSINRKDFSCSWRGRKGSACIYPSVYSFDGLFRIILSVLAVTNRRLLVHAGAVASGKKGLVFPGKSGFGKTTICRLVKPEFKAINDEIICLEYTRNKKVRIWGTPFWGEMGTGPVCRMPFSLSGILFLKKNKTITAVKNISPSDSAVLLLQCCCVFGNDTGLMASAFHSVLEIVGKTRLFSFQFQIKSALVIKVLSGLWHSTRKRRINLVLHLPPCEGGRPG